MAETPVTANLAVAPVSQYKLAQTKADLATQNLPMPADLKLLEEQAQWAMKCGIVPAGVSSLQAQVMIQRGKELGLGTARSLTNLYWTNGRLASDTACRYALAVEKHGVWISKRVDADGICTVTMAKPCQFVPAGFVEITCSYTKQDAQNAGLMDKSTWKKNLPDMLFRRALGRCLSTVCPDVDMLDAEVAEVLEPLPSRWQPMPETFKKFDEAKAEPTPALPAPAPAPIASHETTAEPKKKPGRPPKTQQVVAAEPPLATPQSQAVEPASKTVSQPVASASLEAVKSALNRWCGSWAYAHAEKDAQGMISRIAVHSQAQAARLQALEKFLRPFLPSNLPETGNPLDFIQEVNHAKIVEAIEADLKTIGK